MKGIDAKFVLRNGDFSLDVTFCLPERGITTVSGRSGSGKTSLLRCLAGLEHPQQGCLSFDGETWFDAEAGVDLPTHRRAVGFVSQDAYLFPHLTVQENLAFGARRARPGASIQSLREIAPPLGLDALLDRGVAKLSGGERQRVAIGRALLANPRLLLLDEPVSALDAMSRSEVLNVIERVLVQLPIPCVYVSHDLREAARLADRMLWLDAGRIKASGSVHAVLSDPKLPFAQEADSESVVLGRVAVMDPGAGLARVDFKGGCLWVSANEAPANGEVRVQIRARDVSLALQRPESISVLNILPGRIVDLAPAEHAPSQILVRLDVGGSLILSRVTRRSVQELGLQPGTQVWALIKSVAITR